MGSAGINTTVHQRCDGKVPAGVHVCKLAYTGAVHKYVLQAYFQPYDVNIAEQHTVA